MRVVPRLLGRDASFVDEGLHERVVGTELGQASAAQAVGARVAEVGDAEPTLKRTSVDADLPISVQRPTTKYEARGMRMGSPITELIWKVLRVGETFAW